MPEVFTRTDNTPNPVSSFKFNPSKRSRHEVGYTPMHYSVTIEDRWGVSVCHGSRSLTPTYDMYVDSQFNIIVGKMNLGDQQYDAFERVAYALSRHAFVGKLIIEDSIEGEVVIGRQTPTVHKVLLFNDFGDIMYSVKAKDKRLNHREFIHVSDLEESELVFRFLS